MERKENNWSDLSLELFAEWEHRQLNGENVSIQEICHEHPDLIGDVHELVIRFSTVFDPLNSKHKIFTRDYLLATINEGSSVLSKIERLNEFIKTLSSEEQQLFRLSNEVDAKIMIIPLAVWKDLQNKIRNFLKSR